MGAAFLTPEQILAGPSPNESGGFPRVLVTLGRAFIIVGNSHGATEVLRMHDAAWDWVAKLSPEGDQHELSVIFVVSPAASESLERAIAAGLGLEGFTTGMPGHGLVRMDAALPELLAAAAAVPLRDLPPLRARQAADRRHTALKALLETATEQQQIGAAQRVNEVFRDQEYLMDLFCRPPNHRNGNLLRSWLSTLVTKGVTPDGEASSDKGPAEWLDPTRFY
jgi:hypothetical protein